MLEALTIMQRLNLSDGTIYSDSVETVQSLMQNPPIVHDWRAFDQIWGAWELLNQTARRFKITSRPRTDSGIQIAHKLANQGRLQGWTQEGTGMPAGMLFE